MNFSQPRLSLFSRIVKSFLVILRFQFLEFGVEGGFFLEQVVTPDIGFEDRVYSKGVVANNLRYGEYMVRVRKRIDLLLVRRRG